MTDPYDVLGLPADAEDELIRRRYLTLVKEFPPDRHPQRFKAIRDAFEQLKDLETRLRHRLFRIDHAETISTLLDELSSSGPRPRLPLSQLLDLGKRS